MSFYSMPKCLNMPHLCNTRPMILQSKIYLPLLLVCSESSSTVYTTIAGSKSTYCCYFLWTPIHPDIFTCYKSNYTHDVMKYFLFQDIFIFRNGIRGDCRLLIKCVRFFFEIKTLQSAPCSLGNGVQGVCCPHTLVLQSDLGKFIYH